MKTKLTTLILTLVFSLNGSLFAEDEKKDSEINNIRKNFLSTPYPKFQKLLNFNRLIGESKGRLLDVQLRIMDIDNNWIDNKEYNVIKSIKSYLSQAKNIGSSLLVLKYEAMIKANDIKSLEFVKSHKELKTLIFFNTVGQIDIILPQLNKLQLQLENSVAVLEVDKIINNLKEIRKFVTNEN